MSWSRTTEAAVTILVDNRSGEGLLSEHGLAMWIEADGKRVLFDTGQGALEYNARVLGVDLRKADALVLSHGHYDHTGGIPAALHEAHGIRVYGHPGIVKPRYALRGGTAKAIGMPHAARAALESLPEGRVHFDPCHRKLAGKIGLAGGIPRETAYEDTGGPFFLDAGGGAADPLEDDLALYLRTDDGLVVCAGCSHAGIVNTLHHARRLAGGGRIRAVLGGMHLVEAGRPRLDRTLEALQVLDPDLIVPCHCTGEKAVEALRDAFGKRVSPGAAGMVFRFDAG